MEHFGVKLIKRKYSFKLKREEFALISTKPSLPMFDYLVKKDAYTDKTGTRYRKEWCEEYRKLCLQNFDLNMKYFSLLDREEFNNTIYEFLKKHNGFCKISNLFDYNKVSGYYLMILDEYKQVYIGKAANIKRRIQQHWSSSKPFDRTLFPMYESTTSCFSIDFFRALDTTRIYVWKKSLSDGVEKKLIEDFPKIYVTNRIGGGISNGIEALSTIHKRIFQ
ncbi:hypothetical protein [Bittarella massiliensis (ex Durand et al. 2017)]|uniref:hypothetical protein n=1 Tax=Bittarella massiliensis (ex Durand et al. 2017) TaxID=1720313 RepID=UPI001AA178BE|nr:hypothetical protein [Bittarella massiliensis (ex Durand et al. 2017)]MBO1680589.1 hypothetical protein [Bittarella massiliensis (ex Durand et al. 2017)]